MSCAPHVFSFISSGVGVACKFVHRPCWGCTSQQVGKSVASSVVVILVFVLVGCYGCVGRFCWFTFLGIAFGVIGGCLIVQLLLSRNVWRMRDDFLISVHVEICLRKTNSRNHIIAHAMPKLYTKHYGSGSSGFCSRCVPLTPSNEVTTQIEYPPTQMRHKTRKQIFANAPMKNME